MTAAASCRRPRTHTAAVVCSVSCTHTRTRLRLDGRGTDCIRWTRAKLDALPRTHTHMAPFARGSHTHTHTHSLSRTRTRFCLRLDGQCTPSGGSRTPHSLSHSATHTHTHSWMDGRSRAVTGRIFQVCVVVVVVEWCRARPTNDRSLFTRPTSVAGKHGAVCAQQFVETVGEGRVVA